MFLYLLLHPFVGPKAFPNFCFYCRTGIFLLGNFCLIFCPPWRSPFCAGDVFLAFPGSSFSLLKNEFVEINVFNFWRAQHLMRFFHQFFFQTLFKLRGP